MGQRIVFELLISPESEPRDWERVEDFLASERIVLLDTPSGTPPFYLRAVLPEQADPDSLLQRLRSLDGVGRADIDAWREAF